MADNKILYGLKNCFYSVKTGTTYAVPVALPGAVSLSMTPQGESSTFYADDMAYVVFNANNGYEGSLELANVPESFYKDVLGFEVDSDGNLMENANNLGGECALLFEFAGDVKAKKHKIFCCKFARPSIEGETKGESIEPKTTTFEFKATPLPGGAVKVSSTEATTAAKYDSWYTAAPTIPTAASK